MTPANEVAGSLAESPASPESRVVVSPRASEPVAASYDVRIGPGLLAALPDRLRSEVAAARYAIIADGNTGTLYGEPLRARLRERGIQADLLVFPAGEAYKSRESWTDLSDRMLAAQHGRDSAVLALGGGVVGDLGGFVAATYMRGLPLIQLPTTLLAMIDSSVGGKTGVDTGAGKNLIGAFHQPSLVLADTDTLRTLPPAEVRAGLAEAVKHGAIADRSYFDWIDDSAESLLALDPESMVWLIRRSVEIKGAVVGADERESGLRKTLNFGHTVGHAVEALSRFSLLHGEAISIGMVVEARIGERLGITRPATAERLERVLQRFGLPTAVPDSFSPEAVLSLTRVDKKARAGRVEYSLIASVGEAAAAASGYAVAVDDALVLDAIRGL